MLPTRRLRQQAPEDVDRAVLLVDGHGAGLRPGLLSSVEPIGIVGTPSCEVPLLEVGLLEALDCEDAVLPAAGAWPHILVDRPVLLEVGTVPVGPSGVMPKTPRPSPLKGAVEFIAFPVTVLVGEHAPTDEPELTPGVASGAAPKGIPVGANTPPEVLIPRGEVAPIPELGEGVPIPPTCAYAQPEVTTIAVAMAIKRRVIAASKLIQDFVNIRSVSTRFPCETAVNELVSHEFADAKIGERPRRTIARLPVFLA